MTTYELPPEPPVGSRVTDKAGNTWHRGDDWWELNFDRISWRLLMMEAPLTLIEPDPWPTAPLIVASVSDSESRELFTRSEDGTAYESLSSYIENDAGVPLTNVVPVTVVPVAEWEAMREGFADLKVGYSPGSPAEMAFNLIAATDALGVDL